jgi:hypothetical protein
MGDRHVYGAKSRFLTPSVMACLQPVTFGEGTARQEALAGKPRVDVASTLREMWRA